MTVSQFVNKVLFKVDDSTVNKVNGTINDIKATATKVLGAIGIGFSLVNMNALVEEFDAINDKINFAVSGLGDAKEAQKDILAAANAVKTSYSDMADVVTNLVKANSDMFPIEEAISFSTNLTKLMKSAGRNDSEIASIMDGMNKSFPKGAVDTETLNKMLEEAPETANYLAERLGVAKTELLQLATDGKISLEGMKAAFVESSDEIDTAFSQLNFSVSDALLNIRNKWGFWLKETDEMLGLTNTIGKVMVKGFDMAMSALNRVRNGVVWLTDKLGGTEKVVKLIGIAMGALGLVGAVSSLKKITDFLDKVSDRLGLINKRNLALVAGVLILALLVEDFINFMQGNDSVIGILFEKAGVDCDKLRKDIIQIWENVKTVLSAIWQGIQNVAIPVFQGIWEAIKSVFEAIGGVIEKIAPKFANFISELASGKVDTEKWVKVGEVIAKIGVAIAGTVIAVKTAIVVVRTVVGVVKGVTAAISFLTSPVGLVIVAIAALIAIGALLWKNWDKIKTFAISIWTSIKDFISGILTGVKDFFVGIWDSISGFISGVWTGISSTISGALSAIWGVISSIFLTIWGFISETLTNIWNGITSTFTNILNSITETVGNIKNSIVEGFQAAIDWITSLPAQALQWGADIIQGIVDGITGAVGKVGEAVAGVAGKIKSFLGFSEPEDGPLSDFHTYMPDMIQLMVEGIQKGKSFVSNAIKDLTGGMSDEVQNIDPNDGDPDPKKPKGGGSPEPTPPPPDTNGSPKSPQPKPDISDWNPKDSAPKPGAGTPISFPKPQQPTVPADAQALSAPEPQRLPPVDFSDGVDLVKGIASTVTDGLHSLAAASDGKQEPVAQKSSTDISDGISLVKEVAGVVTTGVRSLADAANEAAGGSGAVKDALTFAGNALSSLTNAVAKRPQTNQDFTGEGTDSLDAIKEVAKAVTGCVQTLVDTVKENAGGSESLKDAMRFIGNGMNALIGAATPRPSTVSTVTGSNNVSRSVVQNIEINNKYEGDRAGQQKSSQAAKQAGKDITSELARGLSYAR